MDPLFSSWTSQAHKMKRLDFSRDGFDGLDSPHVPLLLPPPPLKRARASEGASSSGYRNLASFFDFERYRSSIVLRADEIWAVRDDYGMPRRYVVVERDGDVSSTSVRYLKYNRKVAYQRYKSCGILHACGIFVGDTDPEPLEPPYFSHKVVGWGNKKRPSKYTIYPRRGEVWAITKCPISMFGFSSPSLITYQMVEVLEDYSPEAGAKVVSLVKVKGGYRSLFQRCTSEGGKSHFYIGSQGSSIDCFSHQVPHFRFSGEKSAGEFLELDPSCLPLCIDETEGKLAHYINDNYLFLALLDKKVSYRAGESFIWAAYDHHCRVPVRYVAVRSETAHSKVKLAMHELSPCPIYGNEKKWLEAGLPMACGNFIIKPIESEKQFVLSHRVRFPYKDYCMLDSDYCNIHPVEGDVWGIYKDLNVVGAHPPAGPLEYQIVVIVGRTEKAITVASLVRVEGFRGLFKKKSGHASQVQIPANECYRFSHKIPSHRFDGRKVEFLKGFFVLDPLLVPKKEGECFSFHDPFLLERPKAYPVWSAILYIVDKQRNGLSVDGQGNISQQSEVFRISWNKYPEVVDSEDTYDEKPNIADLCSASGHGVEDTNPVVEYDNGYRHLNIKFHDFHDPKSEKDFELGQIWAVHSEFDGLPRSYARIDNFTTSREMVEVTLLEYHPIAGDEMQWAEKKLPIACGTFITSQSTCIKEMKNFSHRVVYDEVKPKETAMFWHKTMSDGGKPEKLLYEVFPRKGEVWAIYKNWSVHWTSSDMKDCRYKLVEVVSDFTEEAGVTVAALVRVEGYENVFRRHLHEEFGLYKTFKRKELMRFSHRIPSVQMYGNKDCSTYEGPIKIKFTHIGI